MDVRVNDYIRAVKADSIWTRVGMIVFNCKHVDGDRLMAVGSYAEEGHGVVVATHGDVGRKFVQIITQGGMVEEEMTVCHVYSVFHCV